MPPEMPFSSLVSREAPATVFVNSHAGRGRANAYAGQVKTLFAAQDFPAHFVFPDDAGELESNARRALSCGARLLLALGGDGTFQALANAADGSNAVLGILPAGGGNDVAASLGINTKHPLAAAQAISSSKVEPYAIDALRARLADGRVRLYFGGGGLGVDADAALLAASTYRRLPGRLRYIAAGLHALSQLQPLHVRAEFPAMDSPTVECKVLLTAALNTPTYGAGIRLAPGNRIDDGWFTVVFLKHLSTLRLLSYVPKLLNRGEFPEAYLRSVRTRLVRLTPDRPCLFHGDGEILGPAPVEIEVVPQAIRVLVPLSK